MKAISLFVIFSGASRHLAPAERITIASVVMTTAQFRRLIPFDSPGGVFYVRSIIDGDSGAKSTELSRQAHENENTRD